ncbi:MAG TPA: hypothetical protein VGQ21_10020 [Thermoanaerobaculia bacterium]|nr:hypothetical protein [Thermoanaerobaculia bacterium]
MLTIFAAGFCFMAWDYWTHRDAYSVAPGGTNASPVAAQSILGGNSGYEVKRPPSANITRGESRLLTWTVAGTTIPIRLRLRNKRPDIASLQGSQTQNVTTSGGLANTVSVYVTGVNPGEADIEVTVLDDSARARQVESSLRTALPLISDELKMRVKEISIVREGPSQQPMVYRDDVFRLLDEVQEEVAKRLPDEELAAFRDAVAELIREAKSVIDNEPPQSNGAVSANSPFVLANNVTVTQTSGRSQSTDVMTKESLFRLVVERIIDFLHRASETSPIDTLCVLTTPANGADIVLYPPSVPSDRRGLRTASRVTLYLGRYAVEINQRKRGYVNLLLDPQRVVECALPGGVGTQACRPISGRLDKCP